MMTPPPSAGCVGEKGKRPPIRMIPSLYVQEVEVGELAVRLRLDVDELQQRQDRADIAELAIRQRRLEAGELEAGFLMDIERQVVRVEQVERAFGTFRIGIDRHAADHARLEAGLGPAG